MRSLLSPRSFVPQRDPSSLGFTVVHHTRTVLPGGISFADRITRATFGEVDNEVTEQAYPLNHPSHGELTTDIPMDILLAVINEGESRISTDGIDAGIASAEFLPATPAIHLHAATLFDQTPPECAVVSMGAIGHDWRGTGQKCVLATANWGGRLHLTHLLLSDTRTWKKETLFLMFSSH
jgi:hypothetical protein